MQILKIIFIILEVVVLFNMLIFVHELGHFLAARWRGLKIDRFAIWFGKPLWKKKIKGVEYALGCIPAGGYVSLPQMAPMELIEGKGEASSEPLPSISAFDKIIVALAGPLFSFGLAVFFAFVVTVIGRPVGETESTTTIGFVEKDGPADKAGLHPGDQILEINNLPVTKFSGIGDSVMWRVVSSEGENLEVKVRRGDETKTFYPTPVKDPTKAWQRKSLRQIKIGPAESAVIAEILSNSPAQRVGLKTGDQILAVNGEKIYYTGGLHDYIEAHPAEKNLTLAVRRDGTNFAVSVIPEKPVNLPDDQPMIGISAWSDDVNMKLMYPTVSQQIHDSVGAMISTFAALFSKKSDIKPQHLGGAVKIGQVYFTLFSNGHGWRLAIWFSVLLNINLALLNMLPFPVLDGGHITLALIEVVRRKPVSAWLLNYLQTGCAVVLICYMLYIAFFDVQDLLPAGGKGKPDVTPEFAPKAQVDK